MCVHGDQFRYISLLLTFDATAVPHITPNSLLLQQHVGLCVVHVWVPDSQPSCPHAAKLFTPDVESKRCVLQQTVCWQPAASGHAEVQLGTISMLTMMHVGAAGASSRARLLPAI